MDSIASQITSLTIVYSSVYSGADQRKYQSPASLAFVRGIHWRPMNSPHKWPVTRKMFPFDDVIMFRNWSILPISLMTTHGVSCPQQLDFLFNTLFSLVTKKTSHLRISVFVKGIHRWLLHSPKWVSNAKRVSLLWCCFDRLPVHDKAQTFAWFIVHTIYMPTELHCHIVLHWVNYRSYCSLSNSLLRTPNIAWRSFDNCIYNAL